MESRDRAPEEVGTSFTIRLVAVSILLVGLCFIQDPGFLVSDTKFDLAVSPDAFLGRALHLWDSQSAFGQLQNQAYGYLWPMGPFFLVLHAVDVPGWVAQRLWQALVLCVGFLGTARLARAFGVRSDAAAVTAGVAFALSARMLTVLGPISIEAWPGALAPWVLLPLVRGSQVGSPRRAAALSALAVAMVGGVNAAATFAVIPLGALWILTRTRGERRRSLLVWWPVFVLLGTMWWLGPLFLLGHFSPPFLDYIETTTVTTFPTTVFDALRGTSNWVPYVSAASRAGNTLLTQGYLALNSGLVLMLGFAGVLDRRTRHRTFFLLSIMVGLLMVTAGHVGSVHGVLSAATQGLLDGPLAPLRNVHKFDPVLRLPLVIGLGLVVDRVLSRPDVLEGASEPATRGARANGVALLGLVMVAVAGASLPAFTGKLEPSGPVIGVPGYWKQAADFLTRQRGSGVALLAPGSDFGNYVWGSPRDEPLQYLTASRWAVRNAIPLAPSGNIRMLDGIEKRFAEGRGSAGFASYLRRNDIGFLVVRNDLRPSTDVPEPVLVHEAIEESPGLERVARFGPDVGGGAHLRSKGERTVVNSGWQAVYPAIEIFRVSGTGPATAGAAPTVVVGGPEDLLDLSDLGVVGSEPTVLASDAQASAVAKPPLVPYVLTDGLQRRERNFGRIHDGYSATLAPHDTLRLRNPRMDYLEPGQRRWQTVAHIDGAKSVTASSSGSDADAAGGARPGELPAAAVDGSKKTQWVSNPGASGRPWWRLDLTSPVRDRHIFVTGGDKAPEDQVFRVRTNNGVSTATSAGPRQTAEVVLPAGRTTWVQVELEGSDRRSLALAEVSLPGVHVRRRLALPAVPREWGDPAAVVLRSNLDARRGCVGVDGDVRCAENKAHSDEESVRTVRTFELGSAGRYLPSLRVRPRGGPSLDSLITRDQPVSVFASSRGTWDPRNSPIAAIDGDPGTSWTARLSDLNPTLEVHWIGKHRITGLSISTSPDTAVRQPRTLALSWPGGRRTVTLDHRGTVKFPAIRTSQLSIRIRSAKPATDLDFESRQSPVPVGVQELRLRGQSGSPLTLSTQVLSYPCGTGPVVRMNGQRFATKIKASPADLFSGKSLPAQLCERGQKSEVRGVDLVAGKNTVAVSRYWTLQLESLVLRKASAPAPFAGSHETTAASKGPARIGLHPLPGDELVGLGQNENEGWQAAQDGRRLPTVTLNGWEQAWLLEGSAPVDVTYVADKTYRWMLFAGAGAFVGLIAAAVLLSVRRRREADREAPLDEATWPFEVACVVSALASLLLAGVGGLLLLVATIVATDLLSRRMPDVLPWLLGVTLFVASTAYYFHPWTDPGGWAGVESWPQYLALTPVLGGLPLVAGRRLMVRRRMVGPSTSR